MCRLHLRKRCQPRLCRNVRSTPTFYQGRDKMHQRCLEKRAHSPCIRVCAVSAVQRQVARDRQDQRVRRVIGRVQPTADGQPSQRREDSAPQPRRCLNSTFPFNPHRDSMVCEWPPLDEVNSISLLNEQTLVDQKSSIVLWILDDVFAQLNPVKWYFMLWNDVVNSPLRPVQLIGMSICPGALRP